MSAHHPQTTVEPKTNESAKTIGGERRETSSESSSDGSSIESPGNVAAETSGATSSNVRLTIDGIEYGTAKPKTKEDAKNVDDERRRTPSGSSSDGGSIDSPENATKKTSGMTSSHVRLTIDGIDYGTAQPKTKEDARNVDVDRRETPSDSSSDGGSTESPGSATAETSGRTSLRLVATVDDSPSVNPLVSSQKSRRSVRPASETEVNTAASSVNGDDWPSAEDAIEHLRPKVSETFENADDPEQEPEMDSSDASFEKTGKSADSQASHALANAADEDEKLKSTHENETFANADDVEPEEEPEMVRSEASSERTSMDALPQASHASANAVDFDDGEKYRSRYVRMGERLEDDLLNTYCDKLHEAVEKEVDGLLAIQYILVEPDLVKTYVTGQKRVCQVLYDEDRNHYVAVLRCVGSVAPILIYDSLIPTSSTINMTLNESVCKQIAVMFRHLYNEGETIEVAVEAGIFPQNDCWSCGLRALAHITHLVLGVDPLYYEYEVECIREFFSLILDTEKPVRQCFEDAKFGNLCEKRESHLLRAKITLSGDLVTSGSRRPHNDGYQLGSPDRSGRSTCSEHSPEFRSCDNCIGVHDEVYNAPSGFHDDRTQDESSSTFPADHPDDCTQEDSSCAYLSKPKSE